MSAYDITSEYAIKLISKVSNGEYHYSHLRDMFISVCPKKWKRYNDLFAEYELTAEGCVAFNFFKKYIDEVLFGLEYITNGKVRYIGTNDIKTFFVK